jgi:hypothetical protein
MRQIWMRQISVRQIFLHREIGLNSGHFMGRSKFYFSAAFRSGAEFGIRYH